MKQNITNRINPIIPSVFAKSQSLNFFINKYTNFSDKMQKTEKLISVFYLTNK